MTTVLHMLAGMTPSLTSGQQNGAKNSSSEGDSQATNAFDGLLARLMPHGQHGSEGGTDQPASQMTADDQSAGQQTLGGLPSTLMSAIKHAMATADDGDSVVPQLVNMAAELGTLTVTTGHQTLTAPTDQPGVSQPGTITDGAAGSAASLADRLAALLGTLDTAGAIGLSPAAGGTQLTGGQHAAGATATALPGVIGAGQQPALAADQLPGSMVVGMGSGAAPAAGAGPQAAQSVTAAIRQAAGLDQTSPQANQLGAAGAGTATTAVQAMEADGASTVANAVSATPGVAPQGNTSTAAGDQANPATAGATPSLLGVAGQGTVAAAEDLGTAGQPGSVGQSGTAGQSGPVGQGLGQGLGVQNLAGAGQAPAGDTAPSAAADGQHAAASGSSPAASAAGAGQAGADDAGTELAGTGQAGSGLAGTGSTGTGLSPTGQPTVTRGETHPAAANQQSGQSAAAHHAGGQPAGGAPVGASAADALTTADASAIMAGPIQANTGQPATGQASSAADTTNPTAPGQGSLSHSGSGQGQLSGQTSQNHSGQNQAGHQQSAAVAATTPAAVTTEAAPSDAAARATMPNQLTAVEQAQFQQQVSARLNALRQLADGSYQLSIKINPEHLGPVKVSAIISDGQLAVDLSAANNAARDALRQAMPDMRRDLGQGGMTVSVDVSGDDSTGRGDSRDTGRDGDGRTSWGQQPGAARRPQATTGVPEADLSQDAPKSSNQHSAIVGVDLVV